MKKSTISFLLFLSALIPVAGQDQPLVTLANPLQGTDSTPQFSHGNTHPEIALPFPMNGWAPYTEPQDNSFYYQYRHHKFYGIRQTHEPSVWIRDHATFSLMPISGNLTVNEDERASDFRHEAETAEPSYYKVHLDTWGVTAEVTPTKRAARFRFTFEKATNSFVIVDVFKSDKPGSVEIIPSENKIIGIARNNSGAAPDNYGSYFVIIFDKPFSSYGVWSNDGIQTGVTKLNGRHVGAYVQFDTQPGDVVECKTASSFISADQATLNLNQEIGSAGFDEIRQRADDVWNKALGRAEVEGGSDEQRRTFYSALYRSILFPHCIYELNADQQPIYYSPNDGKVHPGVMYTDTGYWDTYRSAHPVYDLLFPDTSAEILQSLVQSYKDTGWLPAWSSPGNRQAMIGNHAFSVLADGWVKGIHSFDLKTAVDAMVHDAHNEGFFGMGRTGYKYYDSLGYIPYPPEGDATSRTLDYAYDDFCAAKLAAAAGRSADEEAFLKTTMNYTNVFDPKLNFMRGRKADGSWNEPFDPDEWGGPFIEGNAWQWTWDVPQDEPGLIQLMGGDDAFCQKLDAMFAAGSRVNTGTYHTMIHEMNEMVAQNLGQFDHGNEPVHHVLYLYDYAGQPWKTQVHVRQVMNLLYQPTPDGLPGDEDNGQMSAWYVLSALGIYPVCPGDPNYLIGSPIFDKATLHLANGKKFVITAENNGPQEYYIDSATLNGEPFNKTYISHQQILDGGELKFQMVSFPNYQWATNADSRPPSPLAEVK